VLRISGKQPARQEFPLLQIRSLVPLIIKTIRPPQKRTMNQSNEDRKQPDNMEKLKQQASACGCGSGCACNTPRSSQKTRWVIGAIVLVAAGALAVRAVIKSNRISAQTSAPAFSVPTTAQASVPPQVVQKPAPEAQTTALETGAAANPSAPTQPVDTNIGTSIGAFTELNVVAATTNAVFIYLPGKDVSSSNPPLAAMQAAARTIESRANLKCGVFTLKADSPDYSQIASQVSVPGVLAVVKGRGMSAIADDITEEKLVQCFVAASNAGGCGAASGGCGPSGCK